MKPKLAVLGTGISGMACGHFLQRNKSPPVRTEQAYWWSLLNGRQSLKQIPIDMGFMVFNKKTYPNLTRLFDELKVPQTIQHVLQCATPAQGIGILWVQPKSSVWAAQNILVYAIGGCSNQPVQ